MRVDWLPPKLLPEGRITELIYEGHFEHRFARFPGILAALASRFQARLHYERTNFYR